MNRVFEHAPGRSAYLVLAVCLLTLTGCLALDERGASDLVRQAEATRVALAARDESAQRAVERQILEAQADEARVKAEAARSALPAATLRQALVHLGLGVGVMVLAIGSAFALVAWLNKRATAIYPNSAGMYPVIVKRLWNGVTIVHDPNRALGPTTIYAAPGPATILGGNTPQPLAAHFPAPGSENTMLQLSTQAQAIGLMAAATHNNKTEGDARRAQQVAEALVNRPALSAPLPSVRASPLEVSHVERLLLAGDE